MIKKSLMILLIFFFPIQSVLALPTIDIQMPQVFEEGEPLTLGYTLLSEEDGLVDYTLGINCSKTISILPFTKSVDLKAGVPFEESFTFLTITDETPSQDCVAEISIIDPYTFTKESGVSIKTNKNLVCDGDGACKGKENQENCPVDCSSTVGENTSIPLIYLIFLIPVLIIGGLLIYLIRLRKKQKEETEF